MTHRITAALIALVALALLGAAPAAEARTLYVANNGVDNAVCGVYTPCRSISRAISNAVTRDTIIVGPGIYGDLNRNGILGEAGEETGYPGCKCMIAIDRLVTIISSEGADATVINARNLNLDRNVYFIGGGELGRPGQGFTITQTNNGFSPTVAALVIESVLGKIRGNQIVSSSYGLLVNGVRVIGYSGAVLIEGNDIRGWGSHGIYLTGSGATVRKNSISMNQRGIRSEGTNTIEGNVITGNEYAMGLFDHTTVVGNAVYGNGQGIQINGSFSGTIERNNIFGNRSCGLNNDPGVPYLTVATNYWGRSTGPGGDPADTVCNAFGTSTQVTPFATRPFAVTAPIDP